MLQMAGASPRQKSETGHVQALPPGHSQSSELPDHHPEGGISKVAYLPVCFASRAFEK
jgi:hypothetical protein